MIELHNFYVVIYHTAKKRFNSNEHISLCLKIINAFHLNQRHYNHSIASKVIIIIIDNDEDEAIERDLIIQACNETFHFIFYLKSFYILLRYSISFVYENRTDILIFIL